MAVKTTASSDTLSRNDTAIGGTSLRSASIWLRKTSASDNALFEINYGGGTWGTGISTFAGDLHIGDFDNIGGSAEYILSPYVVNQWYHVVYTYDGTNVRIYLDGALVLTTAWNSAGAPAGTNWNFGQSNVEFQDITIWDATLTADDAAQLYRRRLPARSANLLAYYPLHDVGNRTIDYSGNNRTLTVTNNVTAAAGAPQAVWGTRPERTAFYEPDSGSTAINGTGTTQTTGTAAVTSSAALVASGTTQTTGTAAVTKAAGLAATGTTQTTGTAAVSSGASAAGSGLTQTTGVAALTAAAAIAAAGTTQTTGTAAVTAAAPVAAGGSTQCTGTAVVTSSAAIAATGTTQTTGSVAMLGSLSAVGNTQTTGTAAVTSSAPIVASGSTQCTGTAAVTIAYAITAIGNTQTTGAAAMTAAAPIAAVGLTQCTGSAVFDTGGGSVGGGEGAILVGRRFMEAAGRRRIR